MEEILQGAEFDKQTAEIQANLLILLEKCQKLREKYGKSMVVSSGLRTMEKHLAIYKAKGITDKSKIPMKSNHLFGRACDFSDPKGELKAFILANPKLIEELDLYLESTEHTLGWIHIQTNPFGSYKRGGSRFFKP